MHHDMGVLTGVRHGDAANELFGFYQDKAQELEEAGQYFMAAIALAFALETAVLTYLLVEFGEDNGGELTIPDSVNHVSADRGGQRDRRIERSDQCAFSAWR